MVTSMKEKARTKSASLVDIYQSETAAAAMQPNLAANVPTFQEILTTLARHRRKQFPVLPQTRNDIDLPPALTSNSSGQPFLLHSAPGNDLLVFCTPANLRLLCDSQVVCIDGTFGACPALYSQLFTFHGFFHDKLMPLVYCLLPDKRRETYKDVFAVLKRESTALGLQLQPTCILSDFESAIIPAVRHSFPKAQYNKGVTSIFVRLYTDRSSILDWSPLTTHNPTSVFRFVN